MSNQSVEVTNERDPYRWRAATGRVGANALLVLLSYEAVAVANVAVGVVAAESLPVPLAELVPILAVFLLVRWIFVLPLMLPVLIGIEFVARRVPHARVLTALVAFSPMIIWEATNTPAPFPSVEGAILGLTAVLFAIIARLPPRSPPRTWPVSTQSAEVH
jgi:hypothetical protein